MSGFQEVPTDDLLSFQDYPRVHSPNSEFSSSSSINIDIPQQVHSDLQKPKQETTKGDEDNGRKSKLLITCHL